MEGWIQIARGQIMDSENLGMSIVIDATLIVLAFCFSLLAATIVWEGFVWLYLKELRTPRKSWRRK